MQLSSIRVNSLEVVRQLSGQMGVSGAGKVLLSASPRSGGAGVAGAATPGGAWAPGGLFSTGRSAPQDTEVSALQARPQALALLRHGCGM